MNDEVGYGEVPECFPTESAQAAESIVERIGNSTKYRGGEIQSASMWATKDGNYVPCDAATPSLPAGQYIVTDSDSGIYFTKKTVSLDSLIVLPDNNTERVVASIDHFWNQEEAFREFGFLWKRGIMLWGPPGSGKTSTVQQLSQQIVDRDGISLYCTRPMVVAEGLRLIRKIEPTRPIVVILEDIDSIIYTHGESDLLAMLDGELQIDNVVFVATTNYPEKLDKRFINRPSRFDEIIKIGMPSDISRRTYLSSKNPKLTEEELDHWVNSTKNFSIAHMRELLVSVECLGTPVDESIDRLKKMNNIKLSSDDSTGSFGLIKED